MPKATLLLAELTFVLQLHPYASLAWSLLSKIPEVRHLALSEDAGDLFFFCLLVSRLCYSRFSVTTMSDHYLKPYAMRLRLQKMRTL
jgi:hypothetical protein